MGGGAVAGQAVVVMTGDGGAVEQTGQIGAGASVGQGSAK